MPRYRSGPETLRGDGHGLHGSPAGTGRAVSTGLAEDSYSASNSGVSIVRPGPDSRRAAVQDLSSTAALVAVWEHVDVWWRGQKVPGGGVAKAIEASTHKQVRAHGRESRRLLKVRSTVRRPGGVHGLSLASGPQQSALSPPVVWKVERAGPCSGLAGRG